MRRVGGRLSRVRVAMVGVALLGGALSWQGAGGAAASPPAGGTAGWLAGWPLTGHDPQGTNRGVSGGPVHPQLLLSVAGMAGPVLVGPDGSMYGWGSGGLRALDARGRSRWAVAMQAIEGGPPALAPDGLLLVNGLTVSGSGAQQQAGMAVVGIAPSGRVRWALHTLPWANSVNGTFEIAGKPLPMGPSVPLSKGVAPMVSPAGTLYMPFIGPGAGSAGLEQITPAGEPLRRLGPGVPPLAFAVGADGTVYELGSEGAPPLLVALDAHGVERWRRTLPGEEGGSSVLVGRGGMIYASATGLPGAPSTVVAYTRAGRLRWRLAVDSGSRLAERTDGVLLVADAAGLRAVGQNGTPLWRLALGTPNPDSIALPSLIVDAAGRAYAGASDGMVRGVSADGRLLWSLRAGPAAYSPPALALGPGGRLIVAGTDNVLRVYR